MRKPSVNKAPVRGRPEMPVAKRELMKHRISEAAKTLFQNQGYAKVSMRRIAKEIGCTPMTIYGYYPSKIDMLRTLWDDVFKDLFDHLEALKNTGDPQLYLERLCAAYVRFWTGHPDQYRLVFMAEGVTQPDVSLFLDNPEITARYGLFLSEIQNLDRQGDQIDTKSKLDFLLSAMHGIAHNKITMSGYPWSSTEDQIKYAVKAIL